MRRRLQYSTTYSHRCGSFSIHPNPARYSIGVASWVIANCDIAALVSLANSGFESQNFSVRAG